MKKVVELIRGFGYEKLTKKYYSRIGKMISRYGEEAIIHALGRLRNFQDKNLNHLLGATEKICQKNIAQEKFDGDWEDI